MLVSGLWKFFDTVGRIPDFDVIRQKPLEDSLGWMGHEDTSLERSLSLNGEKGLVSTWMSDDVLLGKCRLGIEMLTLSVKYGSPAA